MTNSKNNPHPIEIEDYYDKVHQSTWARRSAGIMAGATLGVGYGAAIGAIAAYIPSLLQAIGIIAAAVTLPAITVTTVATSAAMFAGIAGLLAIAAVATVGGDSASVASGMAEKEKREKTGELKENGLLHPEANTSLHLKETKEKWPAPFKWRTALFTVPLFAAFGALIAMNPITAPTVVTGTGLGTLGLVAGNAAATTASAAIFGMWGAVFATPQSFYTNKMTNFYLKVLKDKLFAPEDVVSSGTTPHTRPEIALSPELNGVAENTKHFASEKTHFSFQGMVDKSEEFPTPHFRG